MREQNAAAASKSFSGRKDGLAASKARTCCKRSSICGRLVMAASNRASCSFIWPISPEASQCGATNHQAPAASSRSTTMANRIRARDGSTRLAASASAPSLSCCCRRLAGIRPAPVAGSCPLLPLFRPPPLSAGSASGPDGGASAAPVSALLSPSPVAVAASGASDPLAAAAPSEQRFVRPEVVACVRG